MRHSATTFRSRPRASGSRRGASEIRRGVGWWVLLAASCGAPQEPAIVVEIASAPSATHVKEDTDGDLLRLLAMAREAYAKGNTRPLFALFALEMEVQAARAKASSPRDAIFGRARLEAIYGWTATNQGEHTFRYAEPRVTVNGNNATIEWESYQARSNQTHAFGEHYELAKKSEPTFRAIAHGGAMADGGPPLWAAATWAIAFYQKHGFRLVTPEEKDRLLRKYWNISDQQIETSVVLADERWSLERCS
jgi:hypothetical protein